MAIDTLQTSEDLVTAGLQEDAAKAITKAIGKLASQESIDALKEDMQKTEARLDKKIDTVATDLHRRMDDMGTSLNKRIDDMGTSLNGRINDLDRSLGGRIDSLKWTVGISFALNAAAVAGIIAIVILMASGAK